MGILLIGVIVWMMLDFFVLGYQFLHIRSINDQITFYCSRETVPFLITRQNRHVFHISATYRHQYSFSRIFMVPNRDTEIDETTFVKKTVYSPPSYLESPEQSIFSINPSFVNIINTTTATMNTPITNDRSATFVNMLRGSAQYISNHRNTIIICHIPGEFLEWEGFSNLIDDISLAWLLGMKIVLVVGCRGQIDARLTGVNTSSNKIRITDMHVLRIIKEEAGYARFELERQLARSLRLRCVNGSGDQDGNVVSGNFYSAQPYGVIDGVDYCYTGFPRKIEVDRIQQVLEARDVVLLTALGVSSSGEVFNVPTELLAATVAGNLRASKLLYFTVHGGALVSTESIHDKYISYSGIQKHIKNLRVSDARKILHYYHIHIDPQKGFTTLSSNRTHLSPAVTEVLFKVGLGIVALDQGVKRTHIINMSNGSFLQELYTRDGSGTLISRDLYEGIRRAHVNDVAGIYNLIEPLFKTGTLVHRSRKSIEKDVASYYVYTRDNHIVACAQLQLYPHGYAEIGCLVVSEDYRRQGWGEILMGYLERLSIIYQCQTVFVLSTQTMEWFVERGFQEVTVEALPECKKVVYNYQRRSRIYMKALKNDRELDAAEFSCER